jgi:tight adherence protein B
VIALTQTTLQAINSAVIFLAVGAAVWIGLNPAVTILRAKTAQYNRVLRAGLLIDLPPWALPVGGAVSMLFLALLGAMLLGGSVVAMGLFAAVGLAVPTAVIRLLRRRRLQRLEEQLVGGIQTLASGVRAGLNLVQSLEMIANDGPAPLSQEIEHLLREYEYGVPLDEAMDNTARRIGSSDYELLFAALHTHRQRGGNLGETLDRIASSIREIQRLENRVEALTAQGRATARWLGAMPAVVLGILYFIQPTEVIRLFTTDPGKVILAIVIVLNLVGFLWIRRIMAIDI